MKVVRYGPVTSGMTSAMASAANASNQPSPDRSAPFFLLDTELRDVGGLLSALFVGEVADETREADALVPPNCIIPSPSR
jgi:hypothetical protein